MNILVIKTGALGDVVRTSFIAQALKERYKKKETKIFWITQEKAIPLFINNPYVFKVISEKNKEKLKNINFEIVINLEEDESNAKFASSLKSKRIIGAFWNKDKIDYTDDSKYWFDTSLISKYGKKKADILKKENRKTHKQIMAEIINVKEYEKYEPFLRLNNIPFAINTCR